VGVDGWDGAVRDQSSRLGKAIAEPRARKDRGVHFAYLISDLCDGSHCWGHERSWPVVPSLHVDISGVSRRAARVVERGILERLTRLRPWARVAGNPEVTPLWSDNVRIAGNTPRTPSNDRRNVAPLLFIHGGARKPAQAIDILPMMLQGLATI
jgi:hypothetical protein